MRDPSTVLQPQAIASHLLHTMIIALVDNNSALSQHEGLSFACPAWGSVFCLSRTKLLVALLHFSGIIPWKDVCATGEGGALLPALRCQPEFQDLDGTAAGCSCGLARARLAACTAGAGHPGKHPSSSTMPLLELLLAISLFAVVSHVYIMALLIFLWLVQHSCSPWPQAQHIRLTTAWLTVSQAHSGALHHLARGFKKLPWQFHVVVRTNSVQRTARSFALEMHFAMGRPPEWS